MAPRPFRISKAEWARLGGFRNARLFRAADSRGRWRYYSAPC